MEGSFRLSNPCEIGTIGWIQRRDRDYSTTKTSRLCKRRSPQTNGSCPVPSPGVPLCQSRTHPSSACYNLTFPLRFQAVLAHTTLPPSNILAEIHTSGTQVLPLTVLKALHGTQGARCACYVLPQPDISVKTQHCCSIGILRCYALPDFMFVCFRWQAISAVGYHGQSAGCSAAQNMQG